MIDFSCDYNCGCAPEILAALAAANESQHATYGLDVISARAKEKIRAAVGNPDADVYFLVGGTQTNATVLSAILRPWEGVVSAAVEATGHKVLTVAADEYGRIEPETLRDYLRGFYADETCPHMVQPGAVYLSHPTEYGGLYSAAALREIRAICDEYALRLFVDGARLAYALASPETPLYRRSVFPSREAGHGLRARAARGSAGDGRRLLSRERQQPAVPRSHARAAAKAAGKDRL